MFNLFVQQGIVHVIQNCPMKLFPNFSPNSNILLLLTDTRRYPCYFPVVPRPKKSRYV